MLSPLAPRCISFPDVRAVHFKTGRGQPATKKLFSVVPVNAKQQNFFRNSIGRSKLQIVAKITTCKAKDSINLRETPRKLKGAEQQILEAICNVKGRGVSGISSEQRAALEEAVAVLEAAVGVEDPTASPLLEGRWRLLFTSRPGSASPIQRSFTGVDAFTVYQDIQLAAQEEARVNNVVDFGERVGELKVEAQANTDTRPLPGFTPRKGAGLPLFGKSFTDPPVRKNMRIDFQFDRAAFSLTFLPFKIPYPVPFKQLGDETKGWIDITYLSPDGTFRITRGNKGTLFILAKDEPPQSKVLGALTQSAGTRDVGDISEDSPASPGSEADPR